MKVLRFILPALCLAVVSAGQARAAILIDDFTTSQSVTVTSVAPANGSSVLAPEAIGGERDMWLNLVSGFTTLSLYSNAGGSQWLIQDSGAAVTGLSATIWDGIDGDPLVLDPTGLGGIDLTAAGNNSIQIGVEFADLMGNLIFRVYDAADATGGTWSEATLTLPGGIIAPTNFLLPYASFTTVGPNGAASFSNVGAMSLTIDNTLTGALDIGISDVQAVPEPATAALAGVGLVALLFARRRRSR